MKCYSKSTKFKIDLFFRQGKIESLKRCIPGMFLTVNDISYCSSTPVLGWVFFFLITWRFVKLLPLPLLFLSVRLKQKYPVLSSDWRKRFLHKTPTCSCAHPLTTINDVVSGGGVGMGGCWGLRNKLKWSSKKKISNKMLSTELEDLLHLRSFILWEQKS